MLIQKVFEVQRIEPMEQTQAMTLINALAGRAIDPEAIFIDRMILSSDRYDRSSERIPESYQRRFEATLPGRPVLTAHAKQEPAQGRYFSASVQKDANGKSELWADYYLPARSDLTERVKLGIAREVSIGFMAAGRTCDLCGGSYDGKGACAHIAGAVYDGKVATVTYSGDPAKVEALEGSFVGIACNPDARTVGMKGWLPGSGLVMDGEGTLPQERGMDEKAYQEKIAALEAELAKQKEAAVGYQTKAAELEPKAKDGDAYRAYLIGEWVRMTNAVAKDDEAAKPMLPILERSTAEQLQAMVKMAQGSFDKMFPPTPQSLPLDAGAVPAPDPNNPAKKQSLGFDPLASYRDAYKGIF